MSLLKTPVQTAGTANHSPCGCHVADRGELMVPEHLLTEGTGLRSYPSFTEVEQPKHSVDVSLVFVSELNTTDKTEKEHSTPPQAWTSLLLGTQISTWNYS